MSKIQAFTHASYLYTGENIIQKDGRHLSAHDVSAIEDGAIVFDSKKLFGWENHLNSLQSIKKLNRRI